MLDPGDASCNCIVGECTWTEIEFGPASSTMVCGGLVSLKSQPLGYFCGGDWYDWKGTILLCFLLLYAFKGGKVFFLITKEWMKNNKRVRGYGMRENH